MRIPFRGRAAGGRWIVLGGAVVGLAFAAGLLTTGHPVFTAFWQGSGAWFVVMVLGGTAQSLWRGREVAGAQGPGGMGLQFFGATRQALRLLEQRLAEQMDLINKRLYELENSVFKRSDTDSEEAE